MDGAHISSLLLRFFLMYMPELIQAGKVYRAVPPLFGIKQKGGMMYFTTKMDFTLYVQSLFAKKYVLSDINGRRLTKNEITGLFYKNIEYKDMINFISDTFAVNPILLEDVLYYLSQYIEIGNPYAVASMASKIKTISKNKKEEDEPEDEMNMDEIPVVEGSVSASVSYYIRPDFDPKKLKSILKKKYRFIEVEERNGVICINGLVDSRSQYVFINDKFISACISLIELIKNNIDLYYQIDGENVSLYQLMCKFDAMIPSGLTRYKGLGEQNPDQLGVSALKPDGDRTLIRYTIESAKEEIESFRRIDSSMASLLREVKITKNELE